MMDDTNQLAKRIVSAASDLQHGTPLATAVAKQAGDTHLAPLLDAFARDILTTMIEGLTLTTSKLQVRYRDDPAATAVVQAYHGELFLEMLKRCHFVTKI